MTVTLTALQPLSLVEHGSFRDLMLYQARRVGKPSDSDIPHRTLIAELLHAELKVTKQAIKDGLQVCLFQFNGGSMTDLVARQL
jgi:hypothetical protein